MSHKILLNSRGRYAVMAMVQLAKNADSKPLPLSDIAENSRISLSYLEQLIAGLKKHGLVESHRGPGGGYILGKTLEDITLAEIFLAAEDSVPAKKSQGSRKHRECPDTNALWEYLGQSTYYILRDISLADLLQQNLSSLAKAS